MDGQCTGRRKRPFTLPHEGHHQPRLLPRGGGLQGRPVAGDLLEALTSQYLVRLAWSQSDPSIRGVQRRRSQARPGQARAGSAYWHGRGGDWSRHRSMEPRGRLSEGEAPEAVSEVQHRHAESNHRLELVPRDSKLIIPENPEHLLEAVKEALDA